MKERGRLLRLSISPPDIVMAEKTKISEAPKNSALPPMKKETDQTPSGVGKARTVRCGICKQFGHNRRTCQSAAVAVMKNESNRKGKEKQNVIPSIRGKREISLGNIVLGDGSILKADDLGKWLKL